MATIVRIRSTGKEVVLLGTGFGAFRSSRPSFFFGELAPTEKSGELPVAAVSDADGKIGWVFTEDLEVISIDGATPSQALTR